jgi:hypothetical protein
VPATTYQEIDQEDQELLCAHQFQGNVPEDGVIGRPSLWIAEDLWVLRFRLMVKRGRGYGLKHQKEKRSMDHFAGLDVSVKETSICIVDDTGRIVREVKVASEPAALLKVLGNPTARKRRAFNFRSRFHTIRQADYFA